MSENKGFSFNVSPEVAELLPTEQDLRNLEAIARWHADMLMDAFDHEMMQDLEKL